MCKTGLWLRLTGFRDERFKVWTFVCYLLKTPRKIVNILDQKGHIEIHDFFWRLLKHTVVVTGAA